MFTQTRQMRIAAVMCVIATALAVYTSDALPFYWQVVAWTAPLYAVVYWLMRRFPKAWLLPGLLGPICMRISSSYYGPSGSLTVYQNMHDVFVVLSVFAAVALVFEFISPSPAARQIRSERSASA